MDMYKVMNKVLFHLLFLSCLILLFIIIPGDISARQVYFDAMSKNKIPTVKGEIGVTVLYELDGVPEDRLRLRPVLKGGTVWMLDPEKEVWIGTNEAWESMPSLHSNVKIKIFLGSDIGLLSLLVQDKKLGKVYETSGIPVRSRRSFERYLRILNGNILQRRLDGKIP